MSEGVGSPFEAEPALAIRAGELLKQLESPTPAERDAASKALLDLGPVGMRAVRQALDAAKDAETPRLCESILQQIDASDYLGQAAKGKAQ